MYHTSVYVCMYVYLYLSVCWSTYLPTYHLSKSQSYRKRKGESEREEIFHPLIQFPKSYNSKSWGDLKPRTRSFKVPHLGAGSQVLGPSSDAFPDLLGESCMGNGAALNQHLSGMPVLQSAAFLASAVVLVPVFLGYLHIVLQSV